ncbi:flagellar hook-associated protein FlgK [Desulfosporosinus sp. PR]|uniref:flagellar hook-associated protein FlgK n=1 Tax=Candidatus Desulfosporosinus nitrosoreducens TaxID=3401928 RepID=UPI0027FFF7BF|nr:flagellar hook-associated protein FlgK [Desulfosporosinus sp. PR]MDQ7096264.1 flagellar hook-associated protein FlgK [Desulfosporosinus sp. PR]
MTSTFFGLELSQRALNSQQLALDVTGNNISNANTAGYTRQTPILAASTPYTILGSGKNLSLGTGTDLNTITRARDAFVDSQFRSETSKQQYWGAKEDSLNNIQNILNEPSDNSLSDDMSQFWTAWSDLSNDPENEGARSVVSERAQELTDTFHNLSQQVTDQQNDLNSSINVQITQINTYAQQIGELNAQIKSAEVAGDNPNDLKDQRDSLVDELSQIVNVKVVESKDTNFTDRTVNNYKIIIGNDSSTANTLVDGTTVRTLEDPPPQDSTTGFSQVVWSDDTTGSSVDLGTNLGTLEADLEVRDSYLPSFQGQLDTLAQAIATSINAIHRTGQGLVAATQTDPLDSTKTIGIDFFTSSSGGTDSTTGLPVVTAATINLNPDIADQPDKIATGALTSIITAGDGTIAQKISSLSTGWNALNGLIAAPVSGTSLGNYYSANVAKLGVDVQQATRMKAGEDVLVTNAANQRESISGVSLDEEMTNLIQYQKSYAAAARMVTMMDNMLDSILNMGMTK